MRVAILIPCYNEEATIGEVVRDFTATLPEAALKVRDRKASRHLEVVS